MTSFSHKEAPLQGFYPTIRIQGQVYHLIGSLLPEENAEHNYMQIYFMDPLEASARRHRGPESNGQLQLPLIQDIQSELNQHNRWVQSFKTARDTLLEESHQTLSIVISEDGRPAGHHRGRYNKQVSDKVAVIMPDDTLGRKRDIIVRLRDGVLHRINTLNCAYDPLQYPLLFSHGDTGYHI